MPQLEEPAAVTQQKKKDAPKAIAHRDPTREVVETIVFVVVLVLLLKLFVTEAFVIPTGSMATTLLGYHQMITCPKCGHEFPVNSHDEVEGNQQTGRRWPLFGYTCPNCRFMGLVDDLSPRPHNQTGDRVLVLKPIYSIQEPERGDVVVFKYPEKPQEKQTATNYIKRAEGFGGETIAVYHGDLYVTRSLTYPEPEFKRPANPLDLWEPKYMYSNAFSLDVDPNPKGLELFKKSLEAGFPAGVGGFEIVRKGEKQLLADRRIVWDNDQQPSELAGRIPARWYAVSPGDANWKGDDAYQPKQFAHSGEELNWIRYRNLIMPWKTASAQPPDMTPPTDLQTLHDQQSVPIDNFLGYNAGLDLDPATNSLTSRADSSLDRKWVGDLTLECEAELGNGSAVVMQLSKGVNRFQATFENGRVTLGMIGRGSEELKNPSRPCAVKAGKYKLRFANVDCRLWVWVDGKLIDFGTEGDYKPVEPTPEDHANPEGWTQANDVDAPASIGSKGQATIRHIILNRDIFYTHKMKNDATPELFYVQPGHYLCLGDNSAQSSDSRTWGTVPNRLLLGKAVFVFWPPTRVGFIK